jgi:hypothetical protein
VTTVPTAGWTKASGSARELVNGLPAGAVRWQETADTSDDEGIDCGLDARLENSAGEMQAAD